MTNPTSATIMLEMPNQDRLFEHVKANAQYAKHVVERGMCRGKTLIICGAGPSLAAQERFVRTTRAHHVWGANSALPYGMDRHLPMTHGITVDMSAEMFTDPYEWQRVFPVRYLVSSGVHPDLIPHLLKAGRPVRMFHSYLGIKDPEGWTPPPNWKPPAVQMSTYEMYLYQTIYPGTVQVGYGLNTVPRAICLALWMEYKHIYVVGADCACAPDSAPMPLNNDPAYPAWLESLALYADGRTPAKYGTGAVMVQGVIDRRLWHTRPDMIVSAQHLVHLAKTYPQVQLIGDTLPNALLTQPDSFMADMPQLTGAGSISGFGINAPLTAALEG